MPPQSPPTPPVSHSSFFRHRFSQDRRTVPGKLQLTTSNLVFSRASLPTPPMSGTPESEPSSNPPQLAGRRRKRDESEPLPPSSTPPPPPGPALLQTLPPLVPPLRALPPNTTSESTIPSGNSPSGLLAPSTPPRRPGPLTDQSPVQQTEALASVHSSWQPPSGYGLLPSSSLSPAYGVLPPGLSPQQHISTQARVIRKTKTHVASACANCKRKHLRCDDLRPCRRCTAAGTEDTCRDVEHKKRGRPPINKDNDSTGRSALGSISLPPPTSNRPLISQSYVPLLPQPPGFRMPFGPGYAQPSTAHSAAIAHPQFAPPRGQPSFPPGPTLGSYPPSFLPTQQQSQYGYYNQTQSSIPQHHQPRPSSHSQHPNQQRQQAQQHHHSMYAPAEYPSPLFPRTAQVPSQRPESAQPTDPSGYGGGVPYQLPPILPAPPGTNTEPATAQNYRPAQPQYGQYQEGLPSSLPSNTRADDPEMEERDAKRPRMDIRGILGPR